MVTEVLWSADPQFMPPNAPSPSNYLNSTLYAVHALHRPDLVTSIKTTCIKTTSIETVERAHDEGKLKFQHHWRSLVYNFPVIRKQNYEFKKFIIQKQSIQKNKAIKEYL